jgi:large subunit ribosomal protein L27e
VVVLLHGRYAGHKAVIVKNFDEGQNGRTYGHALVCGIANYPKKARLSAGSRAAQPASPQPCQRGPGS